MDPPKHSPKKRKTRHSPCMGAALNNIRGFATSVVTCNGLNGAKVALDVLQQFEEEPNSQYTVPSHMVAVMNLLSVHGGFAIHGGKSTNETIVYEAANEPLWSTEEPTQSACEVLRLAVEQLEPPEPPSGNQMAWPGYDAWEYELSDDEEEEEQESEEATVAAALQKLHEYPITVLNLPGLSDDTVAIKTDEGDVRVHEKAAPYQLVSCSCLQCRGTKGTPCFRCNKILHEEDAVRDIHGLGKGRLVECPHSLVCMTCRENIEAELAPAVELQKQELEAQDGAHVEKIAALERQVAVLQKEIAALKSDHA